MTLNLKSERGGCIFQELTKKADLVLESYRPGVADALGIGYEACRSVNPGIVYASITGWGQNGPYAGLAGHDINYLGITGLTGLSTSDEGKPVVFGTQIADLNGSLQMVIAILGALHGRVTTGDGAYLDVAMIDGVLSREVVVASEQFSGGEAARPREHPLTGGVVSYNVYQTKDGRHVSLGAVEWKFWRAFCEAIGHPEWEQKHLAPATQQGFHKQLMELFSSKNLSEWTELGERMDCCLFPILSMDEVWEHPQVRAREMTMKWRERGGGTTMGFRFPTRVLVDRLGVNDETDVEPSPELGEHNLEVLQRAGVTTSELQDLREEGVV